MNIKVIFAALFVLLVGFIGYNNYSSYQNKKSIEARTVEIEASRAVNAQALAAKPEPEPVADVGVALEPIQTEFRKPTEADVDAEISIACNSVSDFAETVMEARLRGIPIQDALGAIDGSDISMATKKDFKNVIIQAYKQPNFSTDDYKKEAIREFALKQYLACVSSFNSLK